MKKYLRLLAVLSLSLPLLAYAGVAAESNSSSTTTSQPATTTSAADDTQAMAQRVITREIELKTKLTSTQQRHLKTVCKAGQGHAGTVNDSAKILGTARDQVYSSIITKLNLLVPKLKARNIDTTQLQAEITSLQGQATTFDADIATYRQGVSDLVAIDCVNDPTAFQATLDASRAARDKLAQDSASIKDYIAKTVKPTLQQVRDQLAKTETTTGGKK